MSYYAEHEGAKPNYGGHPYGYDDLATSRSDRDVRHARSSVPWYNPRYWTKKIWAIVAVVVVIIAVIIIAVAVTQSKNNSYPDYSEVAYTLKDTYSGDNFFDNFDYFTGYDPTSGFVHYVPQQQAKTLNLTSASTDSAILKVDTSVGPNSSPDASTGRFSVRITSKKTYNDGLFIFDIVHTPYGCGTWPALWLVDQSNWPDNGEIDVMESTNKGVDGNQMTLHSTGGCSMDVKRKMTGDAQHSSCNHDKNDNAGCSVTEGDDSYGTALNDKGGSVMAVEWRDAGIRMWQFARSAVPTDITNKKPDPSTWGVATADFPGTDCNIGSHFKNQSIVANIDLCGSLGEATYNSSGCPSTCTDFVAKNPDAFDTAFWEFGSFEVYQTP